MDSIIKKHFGYQMEYSCETISSMMFLELYQMDYDVFSVETFEDGENAGCFIKI
jgi:hypothetical protein